MTIEEIRTKKEELDEKYSKLFWNVEENKDAFSKPQYDLMQQHLHELYAREYNLLFGAELLELDKQIEQQGITRMQEMAQIERDKNAVLETIEREKVQRNIDKDIADGIATAINELHKDKAIPKVYEQNWWRRLWRLPERKNRAQELAERQFEAETIEYFERRENEVEDIEYRAYGVPEISEEIYETLSKMTPKARGRRKRARREDELWTMAGKLAKLLTRRQAEDEAAGEDTDTEEQEETDEPEEDYTPTRRELRKQRKADKKRKKGEETAEEEQDEPTEAEEEEQEQTDGGTEESPQSGEEPVQTTFDTEIKPE